MSYYALLSSSIGINKICWSADIRYHDPLANYKQIDFLQPASYVIIE